MSNLAELLFDSVRDNNPRAENVPCNRAQLHGSLCLLTGAHDGPCFVVPCEESWFVPDSQFDQLTKGG